MIDFLNWFMPWALTLQYLFMTIPNIALSKWGPTVYWFGAAILNIGVIIMARTSE